MAQAYPSCDRRLVVTNAILMPVKASESHSHPEQPFFIFAADAVLPSLSRQKRQIDIKDDEARLPPFIGRRVKFQARIIPESLGEASASGYFKGAVGEDVLAFVLAVLVTPVRIAAEATNLGDCRR